MSVHSLATCQTGTTRWLGTADSHGVLKEVILGRRYSQYNLVDASPSGRSIRVQDFVLSMILQTLQLCVCVNAGYTSLFYLENLK